MNIQIYGRNKCFDTRKAERYFKERKIKFQSIDIDRYGLSKGELASVIAAIGIDNLMDIDGKEYERLNLKYINFCICFIILMHFFLFLKSLDS